MKHLTELKAAAFALLIALNSYTVAQVVSTQSLCSGLLYPVGIQNTGIKSDDRLFVLEKRGRIKIVDRVTGNVKAAPFLDIYTKVYPIASQSDERGLLGMAFHPDYATNGFFFLNYIKPTGQTVIARYKVSSNPDSADHNSEVVIMTVHQPYSNHNGGNLMFGPDGYLYISLGDGGSSGDPGNRAQNKDSLLGKMLRIDVNHATAPFYQSAASNPFYGTVAGRDEIFDMGLRNAWRCSFDRLTGDLWMGEVGQNQYEEINFRSACDTLGHNYGWRCYEGNTAYNTTGCQSQSAYVAPVFVYPHAQGCSVTGGYVYRGGLEGSLFGRYLFTDYCQGRIWSTTRDSAGNFNTVQLVQSTPQINNNYSSFGEDVDGELYLAAIGQGRIYRLRDTSCAPTAFINAPDTLYSCAQQVTLDAIYGQGLTYTWTIAGTNGWSVVSGQGTNQLVAAPDMSTAATIYVTVSNGSCSAQSQSVVVITNTRIDGLDSYYCIALSDGKDSLFPFPPGGQFSGIQVTNHVFDYSLLGNTGTFVASYSFADTVSSCYTKASGCVLTSTYTFEVHICGGIADRGSTGPLIYPNPASKEVEIRFPTEESTEVHFIDIRGFAFSVPSRSAGHSRVKYDVTDLSPGMYMVRIKTPSATWYRKVIVAREQGG